MFYQSSNFFLLATYILQVSYSLLELWSLSLLGKVCSVGGILVELWGLLGGRGSKRNRKKRHIYQTKAPRGGSDIQK